MKYFNLIHKYAWIANQIKFHQIKHGKEFMKTNEFPIAFINVFRPYDNVNDHTEDDSTKWLGNKKDRVVYVLFLADLCVYTIHN